MTREGRGEIERALLDEARAQVEASNKPKCATSEAGG